MQNCVTQHKSSVYISLSFVFVLSAHLIFLGLFGISHGTPGSGTNPCIVPVYFNTGKTSTAKVSSHRPIHWATVLFRTNRTLTALSRPPWTLEYKLIHKTKTHNESQNRLNATYTGTPRHPFKTLVLCKNVNDYKKNVKNLVLVLLFSCVSFGGPSARESLPKNFQLLVTT